MTERRAPIGADFYPDSFILLTGGAGRRLGGADKASLVVGGRTLLDHALRQARGRPVVVVGPEPRSDMPVIVTRESPAGGGPAAGVAAGVAAMQRGRPDIAAGELTGLLAVDQAGVTAATWRRLASAAQGASGGAVLVAGGRRHYGVGVFPWAPLRERCGVGQEWHGRPLRELLDPIIATEVRARGDESRDIDTLEDLTWWRLHADDPGESAEGPGTEGEQR